MKAYDFAKMLVSGGATSPDVEIEVCDSKNTEQFFDANVSRVDHTKGLVVLAAHLDYDNDNDNAWINTVNSIKDWFIANNVKPDYTMVFENHFSEEFDNIIVVKPNVLKLV